jgi:pyruvate,water dikinase
MTEKSRLVVSFDSVDRNDVPRVGGKNASLGEMVRHLGQRGVTIPPGFATTAEAYWHFVDANQLRDTIAAAVQELKDGKTPLSET